MTLHYPAIVGNILAPNQSRQAESKEGDTWFNSYLSYKGRQKHSPTIWWVKGGVAIALVNKLKGGQQTEHNTRCQNFDGICMQNNSVLYIVEKVI